jgi:DNA-binding transcriptional MerR regulator
VDARYSIGDLARLTGVAVTAIRFYSDHGILPPAARTAGGYRRYAEADRDRLDLVRTLRDLGFDLPTVAALLRGDAELAQVAAQRADALDRHIRLLRIRHAVLLAVAEGGTNPEELVTLYAREVVEEFLDEVFGADVLGRPGFAGVRTTMTPHLPEDPDPEQLAAWAELTALTGDAEFRAVMRALVARHAQSIVRPDPIAVLREADPATVHELVTELGVTTEYLELVNDPRRHRYVELLAVVNGWAAPEQLRPALDRAIAALRSSPAS